MSTKWAAVVELWPFHGISQILAGPRSVRVILGGDDIGDAMASLNTFMLGLRTNPNIWQAPVMSLARSTDQHDRIGDCRPYQCEERQAGDVLKGARDTVASLSGVGG